MTENANQIDLKDRLSLIETMIAEGRRTTERWGWTFVLWGVAYYVAIAWAAWGGHGNLAWPVTMISAALLTALPISRRRQGQPETTIGRAIGAAWMAMGISLFTVLMSLAISGRYESHVFMAIIGAMLGTANATSSMILRWKLQFACALAWWALAVIACFGSESLTSIAFLAAIFFCQIVFGIYCMIAESRKARQGEVHA
jgi:hypothetical protein